jgi:hypothetical protein
MRKPIAALMIGLALAARATPVAAMDNSSSGTVISCETDSAGRKKCWCDDKPSCDEMKSDTKGYCGAGKLSCNDDGDYCNCNYEEPTGFRPHPSGAPTIQMAPPMKVAPQ